MDVASDLCMMSKDIPSLFSTLLTSGSLALGVAHLGLTGCSAKIDQEPATIIKIVHPKPTQKKLRSDLFAAVLKKDYDSVEQLIQREVDVNSYDRHGHTPLMRAVQQREIIIVQLLLKAGAKIYQKQRDHSDTVLDLLESDGNIKKTVKEHEHALLLKLQEQLEGQEFAQALTLTQGQFIPINSILPSKRDLLDTTLISIRDRPERAKDYVAFLLENLTDDRALLYKNYKNLMVFISSTQDRELLKTVVLKTVNTSLQTLPRGHSYEKYYFFNSQDHDHIQWFLFKLKLLKKYNFTHRTFFLRDIISPQPETVFLNEHILKVIEKITLTELSSFYELLEVTAQYLREDLSLLKAKYHPEKLNSPELNVLRQEDLRRMQGRVNHHFNDILWVMLENSREDLLFTDAVSKTIDIWKKIGLQDIGIQASVFSKEDKDLKNLDQAVLIILKSFYFKKHDFEEIHRIIDDLELFYNASKKFNTESVLYVSNSQIKKGPKKQLIEKLIVNTETVSPQQIEQLFRVRHLRTITWLLESHLEFSHINLLATYAYRHITIASERGKIINLLKMKGYNPPKTKTTCIKSANPNIDCR